MKRVLIISYYWPPAGGPGVQRWLKFVKYLREYELEPVVFVPENASYPVTDHTLMQEIPDDLSVIHHPISEPYQWARRISKRETDNISRGLLPEKNSGSFVTRMLMFIRGNFFIPDARKQWIKPSVSFLMDYLEGEDVHCVITTGPPHSLHLIGLRLKAKTGLKWIADFRDPWTTIGYHDKLYLLPFAKRKHEFLERQVLTTADHIIVTSDITRVELASKTEKPVTVITNGFDVAINRETPEDNGFTMAHIGTLLTERNPVGLWQAIHDLIDENDAIKAAVKIDLFGTVSDAVRKDIARFGLQHHVQLHGYVDHAKAVEKQRASQVLLLLEIDSDETKAILPGKLFEYMASGRPIMAIGPEGSAVETLLSETQSGTYHSHHDIAGLKAQVMQLFNSYSKGNLKSDQRNIEQYSRRALTGRLADLIKH